MQFIDLPNVAVLLIVSGLVIGFGSYILNSLVGSVNSENFNRTISNVTSGLGTMASWYPTLAIIICASVIIGTIVTAFLVPR